MSKYDQKKDESSPSGDNGAEQESLLVGGSVPQFIALNPEEEDGEFEFACCSVSTTSPSGGGGIGGGGLGGF